MSSAFLRRSAARRTASSTRARTTSRRRAVKDAAKLRAEYESRYERQFGLRISDVPVEFLTWSVNVSTVARESKAKRALPKKKSNAIAHGKREIGLGLHGEPGMRRGPLLTADEEVGCLGAKQVLAEQ